MSLAVASIHVYPIKSVGGYSLSEALLTDRGLAHDRRWMLVDDTGRFVSQREEPVLACLHCTAQVDGFRVTDVRDGASIDLPWAISAGDRTDALIWSDQVSVILADAHISAWFSARTENEVSLCHMPDETQRLTDVQFADALTSLSDGFPYLILSQASLEALNARLAEPVPMDRFRPNIVVAGGEAFQEDGWKRVRIGDVAFSVVKPCARCVIITTDQSTGERDREPLRTLATFRLQDNKVLFGMNAVAQGSGTIRVGDGVHVGAQN